MTQIIVILLLLVVATLIFRYSKEGMCDVNYLYLHPPWSDKLIRRDNAIECENDIFTHYYTKL